ncbi:MAG: hypothetical protein AAB837_00540 [Patescibacteria group bacterium]
MTTQIMFKIEDKLKKAAQIKAKKEGITLSEFYKSATRSFVEGKMSVGLVFEEENLEDYTKESIRDLKRGLADFKNGRFFRAR